MNSPFQKIFSQSQDTPQAFSDQFLVSANVNESTILDGTLDIWYRPAWLKLLFWLLETAGILISEQGEKIPTILQVEARRGKDGEALHYWNRTLQYGNRTRSFNTILAYSDEIDAVVDYVGHNGFAYLVWIAEFQPPGRFILKTKDCALNLFGRLLWLPKWLWQIFFGVVDFTQDIDEGQPEFVNVNLTIWHPWFGDCFGYKGKFEVKRVVRE